jgi:hypothetical protein
MKTGRERFRDVLMWAGGLYIVGSMVIFMFNINSYWVPAGLGFIFVLAVIVYLVMGGFGVE